MIGTTLSHYKILDELGRGGMGIVYKAEDTKLDRTVALKVLPPHALAEEDDRARFYREARAAAQLHHPNIATVFAIEEAAGDDGETRPFIAMEYIEGETLRSHIQKAPLKLKDAVRIASEIGSALQAAHEKNIVHRDIKSANVMLTEKSVAKVLDFGLAKTAHSTMLTRMGSTLGTIAYMSPEQARGEEVDNRTDLWSLGVVLYEMITGRVPAPGDYEQAVVYSILNETPEPLTAVRSGVPMQLEWMVNKCLAKDPDERYQSAKDLLVDLKTLDLKGSGTTTSTTAYSASHGPVSGSTITSGPAVAVEAAEKGTLFRIPLLIAVGLVLLAIGFFGASWMQAEPEPPKINRAHLITGISGSLRFPSLSPDGQMLAFGGVDSTDGVAKLFLYNFETGETKAVRNAVQPEWPVFSEDGSRIAFLSGSDLKTVPSLGGDAITITTGARSTLTWGPDRTIFYSDGASILRISEGGGPFSTLVSIDSTFEGSVLLPLSMLPDRSTLLVASYQGNDGIVYAIDIETLERRQILDEPLWAVWYSHSGHLMIMPNASELRARPFDVERLRFSGPPVTLFQEISEDAWSLSASGTFIRMPRTAAESRQYSYVDFEGQETLIRSDRMDYEEFRLSPSGQYIASEVNGFQGGVDQIIIFDAEVGTISPITEGFQHFDPAWSPDGTRIVTGSIDGDGQGLRIVNADGSGLEQLLWRAPSASGNVHQADWSPTGEHIVFKLSGAEQFDLMLYSFEEDSARVFVADPGGQQYPRFSRDGSYVAYQSDELGSVNVYVRSPDGRSKWTVTTAGGELPIWSVTGDEIYFVRNTSIYSISVETDPVFRVVGQPRQVFDAGAPLRFDVHPDGEGFVISRLTGASLGYFELIYNFAEYLKEVAPSTE